MVLACISTHRLSRRRELTAHQCKMLRFMTESCVSWKYKSADSIARPKPGFLPDYQVVWSFRTGEYRIRYRLNMGHGGTVAWSILSLHSGPIKGTDQEQDHEAADKELKGE